MRTPVTDAAPLPLPWHGSRVLRFPETRPTIELLHFFFSEAPSIMELNISTKT